MTTTNLDAFTTAYLTAALFTDDENPRAGEFEQRPGWSIDDLDPEWLREQIAECTTFQLVHSELIGDDLEHAGRDFWYTRNGHGCGFWDGDWPEPAASVLTAASKAYGETYLQLAHPPAPPSPGPRERFRVTFDTISPESAEDGDVCARGFAAPGGWKFDATDPGPHEMTLREAMQIAGGHVEDCGRWFSTTDPDQDYATGEDTFYSIHPPANITRASYARVARVLGVRS